MAQVNWNRQLALAVGLFALGSGAYWLEYHYGPQKESDQEEAKRIFSIKKIPLESITIQDSKKKLTFKCLSFAQDLCKEGDAAHWQIIQPISTEGDDTNINSFVKSLATLSPVETIDLKDENAQKKEALLKEYGLDQGSKLKAPRISLSISGKTKTLFLGNTHPMGETIFASQESDSDKTVHRIYLIPKNFETQFSHAFTHWRNKKIFSVKAHEIEFVSIDTPETKINLMKKEGKWTLQSKGESLVADSNQVSQFLSAISSLTAKDFASEEKKSLQKLGTLSKKITLSFQIEKGSAKEAPAPETLTLYSKKNKNTESLYALSANAQPIFELQSNAINSLNPSLKSLRQKNLLHSNERFSVQKITISGEKYGPEFLAIRQDGSEWKTQSQQVTVNSAKVATFLEQLSYTKIQDFLPPTTAQKKSAIQITLEDAQGKTMHSYAFWEKDQKLYALNLLSSKKELLLLDKNFSKKLPWDPRAFITPIPTPSPSSTEVPKK